jgi:hypothetical protein
MNVALVSGTSRYVCQLQASPTHYYKYSITHHPLEASPCTRRPEPGRIISTTVMMDCHPPPNTSPQNPDDGSTDNGQVGVSKRKAEELCGSYSKRAKLKTESGPEYDALLAEVKELGLD